MANAIGSHALDFSGDGGALLNDGFQGTSNLAAAGNFGIAITCPMPGNPRAETKPQLGRSAILHTRSRNVHAEWRDLVFHRDSARWRAEVFLDAALHAGFKNVQVYSFALVVFVYLGATLAGSILPPPPFKTKQGGNIYADGNFAVRLFPLPPRIPGLCGWTSFSGTHFLRALVGLASIFPLCAALGHSDAGTERQFPCAKSCPSRDGFLRDQRFCLHSGALACILRLL